MMVSSLFSKNQRKIVEVTKASSPTTTVGKTTCGGGSSSSSSKRQRHLSLHRRIRFLVLVLLSSFLYPIRLLSTSSMHNKDDIWTISFPWWMTYTSTFYSYPSESIDGGNNHDDDDDGDTNTTILNIPKTNTTSMHTSIRVASVAAASNATAVEASILARLRYHYHDGTSTSDGCLPLQQLQAKSSPSSNSAASLSTTDGSTASGAATAILCATVKDEKPVYLNEFINYHLALGFHTIYLYDNSDTFDLQYLESETMDKDDTATTSSTTATNEGRTASFFNCSSSSSPPSSSQRQQSRRVHVVHFPGKQKQMRSYTNCLKQYGKPLNYTYAAFFDIDELLILKKHNTLNDFLSHYLPPPLSSSLSSFSSSEESNIPGAIGINWVLYGAHSQDPNQQYEPYPMSKRFQYRIGFNKLYKSIVLIDAVKLKPAPTPHSSLLKDGYFIKDLNGHGIENQFKNPMGNTTTDIAAIYHYKYKSYSEYYNKLQRGRADLVAKNFNNMNRNEQQKMLQAIPNSTIYDTSGWDTVKRFLPEYKEFYGD